MTYFTDNLTREEDEIREEMRKQNAKWGEQNHPDGTGPDVVWAFTGPASFVAESAKRVCNYLAEVGDVTWRDILTEEIAEAYAETDPERLDAELLQAEAVIRQWRLAIRRRPAQVDPEPASLAERLRDAEAERNAFQDAFIRLQSVVEDGSPEAIATVLRDTAYLTAEHSVMADPGPAPVRIDEVALDSVVTHPELNEGLPVTIIAVKDSRYYEDRVIVNCRDVVNEPPRDGYISVTVPRDTLVTPVGGA